MAIHPKVYQSRTANAKKTIAKMDPAVKAEIEKMYLNKKPKTKPTVISRSKPSTNKKKLTGNDAIKEYQKQISPEGMAAAEAAAKKALDKKYPGMFIPETRTTPGVRRGKKK
jgi:hypothetical protein